MKRSTTPFRNGRVPVLLTRLAREEAGQDLIEYALLATLIAILSVAVWPQIVTKMGNGFKSWGTSVYKLWIPNDPQ